MTTLGIINHGDCDIKVSDGIPDGLFICHTNEQVKVFELNFSKGKRDGVEKRWSPKTKTITHQISWKNNIQDGEQKIYDANTEELIHEATFSNGKLSGRERAWSPDGKTLIKDLQWVDGKQTGFNNSGEVERNYKNGKHHGVWKFYSVQGGKYYVRVEENHIDGNKEGDQKTWDHQGNLTQLEVYKNGILQSRINQKWGGASDTLDYRSEIVFTDPDSDERSDYQESVKNGLEVYRNDVGRYEVTWNMGKPMKGVFNFQEHNSPNKVNYNGVLHQDGNTLVKDGIERFRGPCRMTGHCWTSVTWLAGNPIKITQQQKNSDGQLYDVEVTETVERLKNDFFQENGKYYNY